jgi:sulfur transfer protein SufE
MFGWISRADNLVEIVRSMKSARELKALRDYLSDETNTVMLCDSQVYLALKEIPAQLKRLDTRQLLEDIIDLLY